MVGVLVVLAAITLVFGFFLEGLKSFLTGDSPHAQTSTSAHSVFLVMTALAFSVSGVVLAWFEFGRAGSAKTGFVERFPALADFFAQRWYLDRFYRGLVDLVLDRGISSYCAQNDKKVIDGGLHLLAQAAVTAGRRIAHWHRALIQAKLWVMLGVVLVLLVFFIS
jgi:NADH-quinone oxidoreductase subunit L